MDDEAPLSDDLVTPLLHLLQALRQSGGGDLDVHIILLAIAERTIAHPDFRALNNAERMVWGGRPFPTRGVNIRSIADSTGMPRETVRRKVAALTQVGWIARTADGLNLTAEAYRALANEREELERVALKFHDAVQQRKARSG